MHMIRVLGCRGFYWILLAGGRLRRSYSSYIPLSPLPLRSICSSSSCLLLCHCPVIIARGIRLNSKTVFIIWRGLFAHGAWVTEPQSSGTLQMVHFPANHTSTTTCHERPPTCTSASLTRRRNAESIVHLQSRWRADHPALPQ